MLHNIGLGRKDALAVCETVELSFAELYHHFAQLFKSDHESASFWLNTAMEVENPARLFALVARLQRASATESVKIELTGPDVIHLYAHVRSLIDQVKKHPPTMKEPLKFSIGLETRLGGILVANAMDFSDLSSEMLLITTTTGKHLKKMSDSFLPRDNRDERKVHDHRKQQGHLPRRVIAKNCLSSPKGSPKSAPEKRHRTWVRCR
jgi:hypothetical protein